MRIAGCSEPKKTTSPASKKNGYNENRQEMSWRAEIYEETPNPCKERNLTE